MAGLWEEVHGLDSADVVVFVEFGEVTGEGGWVTADVENAWKLGAHEGVEELAVAAFAWGIDDGDVGAVTFAEPFWQPDFSFCGGEVGIGKAVCFGGFFGVVDGLADAVDAVEGLVFIGDEAADGANAAIEIKDGGISSQCAEHVFAGLIEHFGLGSVDLEERRRREVVVQAAETL